MPNAEDKLGYVPSGTRLQYSASWSLTTKGEILGLGYISTSSTVANLKEYLADDNIIIEADNTGITQFNSITISVKTQIDYPSQQDIQDTIDGNLVTGFGNNATLSASSIDNFTLPSSATAIPTGSPNSGWGAGVAPPSGACSFTDKLTGNKNCKFDTSLSFGTKFGIGVVFIILLILAVLLFLPGSVLRAGRTYATGA